MKSLSEETSRQKRHSEELTLDLEQKLETVQAPWQTAPLELDPITGLAGHTAATRELLALTAAGESRFVAIFCVERLDLINSRFGFAAGDQILMVFSQYLAQLRVNAELYLWQRLPAMGG